MVYEFRPFSEEVTALLSEPGGGRLDYMRVCYRGCEPLSLRRGVAYIEFARPLSPSVTKGLRYIKMETLMVTPIIKVHNDH